MIRIRALTASAVALLTTGFVTPPASAQSLPPADPSAIWTLQDENSSISTASLTDRYYVNGLRLGYTSPTDDIPDFAAQMGHSAWGDGRQRISVDLSQSIFTPANTTAKPPPPTDRPYAGVLTANFTLLQDTDAWRSFAGLQLGLVGPGAGAEEVQNLVHSILGQQKTVGWNYYQIHNEPVIELLTGRIWRVPIAQFSDLETDVLPDLTAGVGNLRIFALAGALLRLGQGLAADYGPPRVLPWGMSGLDAYTPVRPLDWYVFVGGDGQAVAHDITLDGNTFASSPHVSRKWDVGELEAGFAVMAYGVRIAYTQVFQTEEFRHQHGGFHQFGSITASVRF
jgi:lipid A 3-O-deacylase